jgi:hypothetical protein
MTKPEYLDRDRGVFGTLVPEIWGPKAPSISIHVGVGRAKDRYLDEATEETVFRIAEQANDFVDRLIVRGVNPDTGRVEPISLLSQRIEKAVELRGSTETPEIPDSVVAFRAIDQAFREMEGSGAIRDAVQAQLMHRK